ncbi:hypothetical protein HNP69_000885 [Chryseobacterium koreense]|nr:hypothetical protein [Chryseobacterium koreense]
MKAYFEKSNDRLKLKIGITKKRRKWFAGVWGSPFDQARKIPLPLSGFNTSCFRFQL